jgi:Mg-chelatase subunit ChlD
MRLSRLSLLALGLATLTNACVIRLDQDQDPNADPVVDPQPDPTTPEPEALAEVAEAAVIGITPHQDFADSGLVDIAILPKDAEGLAIIDDALDFAVTTLDPNLQATSLNVTEKEPEPDKELSAALNLDSSGSMSGTDPMGLRREAAKQFVDQLADTDEVGVFDFGPSPTDGFLETRLLTDFTADRALIDAAIDQVTSSGGTPMFQSIVEVLDFYNQAYPAGSTNRTLVVLGDGQPNSGGTLEEACGKAQSTGIPINTIGFGPAADQSENASENAVKTLRDLADCSGGAYTGVVEASELQEAFSNFGEAARSGSVTITVRFGPVPASGTEVQGTVAVGNGEQAPVEISYRFVAP